MTHQPRLIWALHEESLVTVLQEEIHLPLCDLHFWSSKPSRLVDVAWWQSLPDRLLIGADPWVMYQFTAPEGNWRQTLATFLSSRWFDQVESREMLTGADALYHLLRTFDPQRLMQRILKKWDNLSGYVHSQQLERQVLIEEIYENDTSLGKPRDRFYRLASLLVGFTKSKSIPTWLIDFKKNDPEYPSVLNGLMKRYALLQQLSLQRNHPVWMVLWNLPVIPPDLRPIIKLQDGQIMLSDLNELYRIILARNKAIGRLLSQQQTPSLTQKRLLQKAVDALLGKADKEDQQQVNRPLKSLADVLKGKEGRIRQNLLGKRVDYSGRSVIVVGPKLRLYQCGLPKDMAIELFQPFIIYYLLQAHLARSPYAAKFMLARRLPIVWPVVQRVLQNHPVILNRAPTLHRLGVQAFQPILVKEYAIQLHPLVCAGFNADFDGDQMAVHVPLSLEAQAESSMLMSPYANLVSPATGEAVTVPSQDMLLGLYLLTLETYLGVYRVSRPEVDSLLQPTWLQSTSGNDAFALNYHKPQRQLTLWLTIDPTWKITTRQHNEWPLEIRYSLQAYAMHIYEYHRITYNRQGIAVTRWLRTTLGRLLLNQYLHPTRS